jgi:hypothetical protein
MGADAVDKTLGHSDAAPIKPSLRQYDDFKNRFSYTDGTGW